MRGLGQGRRLRRLQCSRQLARARTRARIRARIRACILTFKRTHLCRLRGRDLGRLIGRCPRTRERAFPLEGDPLLDLPVLVLGPNLRLRGGLRLQLELLEPPAELRCARGGLLLRRLRPLLVEAEHGAEPSLGLAPARLVLRALVLLELRRDALSLHLRLPRGRLRRGQRGLALRTRLEPALLAFCAGARRRRGGLRLQLGIQLLTCLLARRQL